MNNDLKQKLQDREFLVLKDSQRVILKWATGCGKSKMAIDLINYYMDVCPSHLNDRILFVVAERAHINNWKDEFMKWGLGKCKSAGTPEIDIICYSSLHKVEHNAYDVIVFDEAHHMFTEKRLAHIQNLSNAMWGNTLVLLLSATLSAGKQDMAEEIFGRFTVSTVTLKDAIEGDILPDPKVYVVEMELDNTRRHQEIRIGNAPNAPVIRWEDRAKYIYKNTPCIIQCTEYQKNLYLTTTMEYWKQRYERSHSEFQRTKWVNTGSLRKRFLGEAKTFAVRRLLERIPPDRRLVCFCASVAQAENLCAKDTISSKRPSRHNQDIIDAFNKKERNRIYAVGMITEGMNLDSIQVGIIAQLDGKERLFVQKAGRVMRADSPVICIFYFKNTQDEVYLKGALENIDSKFVRYININQLNNIKL